MVFANSKVFLNEISRFRPSVQEVPTAIPAFIGYTSKSIKDGQYLTNKPTGATSLAEYGLLFGSVER